MVLFNMHKLVTLNCRVIATINWEVDIEGHWPNCRFDHFIVDVLKEFQVYRVTMSEIRTRRLEIVHVNFVLHRGIHILIFIIAIVVITVQSPHSTDIS